MADDDIDDRDETDEDLVPRRHIRDLEAKAKDRDELAARVATMERTEAFRSAGLDPLDPKAKYFVKGYEGDLTPEAIKAAATEVGLAGQPAQAQVQQPPDLSAYDRLAGASQGAGANTPAANDWASAMAEAGRIENEEARTAAILGVTERHGGQTNRTIQ